tara:strand:- start:2965 stop:3306 length:342 start_codon:yes stop_codon:yes gene_type:complete
MIGQILLWIVVIVALIFTHLVSFFAGMYKGFSDFAKDKSEWSELDKKLYKQYTEKNLDKVNPLAEVIAEQKIAELNDKKAKEKLLKQRAEVLKKASKEFKKEKKKKSGGRKKK